MTTPLHYLELTELAALIKSRDVSPVEVTKAELARIEALDPQLMSYCYVMADSALAQAETAEQEILSGLYRGPLHGVPIAVKDLCWTKGVPTAGGMPMHQDFRPPEDSTVVARFADAGAVLLGKLQLTESAYADHHPAITPPKNPWGAEYWSGASSSGSGVATAAGLCYGSLGSDTGGSIRFPSAANGLTGLKPTWGRVSKFGVWELAATLDHVGPMARSAADTGVLLGAIAGGDPKDRTALLDPVPDYLAAVGKDLTGVRIGIDRAFNAELDAPTAAVMAATEAALQQCGATIVEIAFPDITQPIADWFTDFWVQTATAHTETYPARKAEYGPGLAEVIELGRKIGGIEFHAAIRRRNVFRGEVRAVFLDVDLVLMPVQPHAAPTYAFLAKLGESNEQMAAMLRYTCPIDSAGVPCITLPGGFTEQGLPIAFQLIGPDLGEPLLIQAGAAYQGVTSWHKHHPEL